MRSLTLIYVFIGFTNICLAQSTAGVKKATAEPTKLETLKWLVQKINAYQKIKSLYFEVVYSYDENECSIILNFNDDHKIGTLDAYAKITFANVDANALLWSAKGDIIRLELHSSNTKPVYINLPPPTRKEVQSYSVDFDAQKLANPDDPNLQDRIIKAIKHLVKLCSGEDGAEKF